MSPNGQWYKYNRIENDISDDPGPVTYGYNIFPKKK